MSETRVVLTILALLGAMVLCGAAGTRSRTGSAALALLSFVWLTLDAQFEGAVLFSVTEHHGLTSSDLVGLVAFAVAAWQWFEVGRSRRRRQPTNSCPGCGSPRPTGADAPCGCVGV